jgi:hypothetical protein
MTPPPSVVVAIPANDEEATIGETVISVRVALDWARRSGVIGSGRIHVAAHRCSDHTQLFATDALDGRAGEVWRDDSSATIGKVRDRAVRRGLARLPERSLDTWVMSTDADTVVPVRWVEDVVRFAGEHQADAVVGLAQLDAFRGTDAALAAYARILDNGYVSEGDRLHQHDHIYGANLAVRAEAYLAASGFPDVPHGEDRLLIEAVANAGGTVLRTPDVVVTTSGRLLGRAHDGLATLLRGLDETSDVSA